MGRVVERAEGCRVCEVARQSGKRIVFTNGCFDLLHHGHVAVLETAASFGDLLVVAVNDDESVRRIKGATRPLLPLEGRTRILAAFESVDLVVPFSEDTPLDTVLALRPDVLVKGHDYLNREVVGADEVRSWGGVVKLVPMIEGVSTSELVRRIRLSAEKGEA
ncbi:MAG: D-glycero-beta-D-manno-heptose 1-phosphate adenylyltransferase [Gemmatimonadetes bacterium]|nr:D-glycero-beta-D-manno-heptose 1-phosphate adenylyltransferase [Gemmatimonadota bacterium]